jgi:hypothetical protein
VSVGVGFRRQVRGEVGIERQSAKGIDRARRRIAGPHGTRVRQAGDHQQQPHQWSGDHGESSLAGGERSHLLIFLERGKLAPGCIPAVGAEACGGRLQIKSKEDAIFKTLFFGHREG